MRILTEALQGIDLGRPLPDGVKLAVSYLRVSTSAQADTDFTTEGFSIPAQREATGSREARPGLAGHRAQPELRGSGEGEAPAKENCRRRRPREGN